MRVIDYEVFGSQSVKVRTSVFRLLFFFKDAFDLQNVTLYLFVGLHTLQCIHVSRRVKLQRWLNRPGHGGAATAALPCSL